MVSSKGLNLSPPPKQYGVTKPISMSGPMDADIQRSRELEKVSLFFFPPPLFIFLMFWVLVSSCRCNSDLLLHVVLC